MTSENDAAKALQDFANGPALEAADDVAKAFEFAGERITAALERAAQSGELSFNALAESVARDLARTAISDLFTAPLQQAIGGLEKSISGPVKASPVTVNMTVSGISNPESFKRSQAQIAAGLARAVADGQRYI